MLSRCLIKHQNNFYFHAFIIVVLLVSQFSYLFVSMSALYMTYHKHLKMGYLDYHNSTTRDRTLLLNTEIQNKILNYWNNMPASCQQHEIKCFMKFV